MINVALAGDFALNLHALAALFHPLPGIRVVSISRSPAALVSTLSASASPLADISAVADHSTVGNYPHVVLLDVNFELRPATQVISFIKRSHGGIRVIVLGLTRDEEAITRLFRAGADRYLPKSADPAMLELAIRDADDISFAERCFRGDISCECSGGLLPWPTVTETEYRFYQLAISDVSNDDIRKKLRICESSYTRLVQQTYDRFNVRSRDGLVVALFKQRWLVRDDG